APVGGELDRVRDQVREHLGDAVGIDLDGDGGVGQLQVEPQAVGDDGPRVDVDGGPGEVAQVDRLRADHHAPALEAGQRQQVVDQREQPARVLVDDVQEL